MSYQYPQRFVKFDPSHMKYLMPRKMSNDPDDLSYNVKIVSGGRSKKVLCFKRMVLNDLRWFENEFYFKFQMIVLSSKNLKLV